MQQDNNNIENKLRQLDGQQLPDLSHMDEHWQKMQAMLQPNAPTSKLRINNKGKLIGGGFGIAIIALCFLGYQKFGKNNFEKQQKIIAAANISDTTNTKTNPGTDVIIIDSNFKTVPPISDQPNKTVYSFVPGWGYYKVDSNAIYFPIGNDSGIDSTSSAKELDRAPLLKQLMNQFIKGPQQFLINNTRDTLITAAEGTSIYIPANSFGGSNTVDVTVTEYYKKSDIILNQLNTASNKDQLVTGGMLNITATNNGKEVKINDKTPIRLFMADTSNINMAGMQVFEGDKSSGAMNWILQGQYFAKDELITEVRVLNISDQPYALKYNLKRKLIAYFNIGDSLKMSRKELKKILKEKYGYHKVHLKADSRQGFVTNEKSEAIYAKYSRNIGDTIWMEKKTADIFKLTGTATRQYFRQQYIQSDNLLANKYKVNVAKSFVGQDTSDMDFRNNSDYLEANKNIQNIQPENVIQNIKEKYSVNITKLGWFNCDRFYADTRKKISYQVDLGDSSMNYYTMLVFDKINSMMTGVLNGNTVSFPNIPINEPVKIISIGINKEGETVYSVTSTITSDQMLTGLKFEKTSATELKTSLSKLDQ